MERRAFEYLLPTVDLTRGQFIHGVIRKDLTRSLGKMHPTIFEETRNAVDVAMGRDTGDWKEVCIKKSVEAVAFRTNLRVLVGSPLCNNEEYVSSTIAFSNWLGGAAIIVAQMPWILKAFFGYLEALPIYYYRQKAFKFLVPVICDRMANLKRMRDDPSFRFEAPDDLITWATHASIGSSETVANSPEHLAVFMLILVSYLTTLWRSSSVKANFVTLKADVLCKSLAAIPTTVLTATNTMLDRMSSDHDAKFWDSSAVRLHKATPWDSVLTRKMYILRGYAFQCHSLTTEIPNAASGLEGGKGLALTSDLAWNAVSPFRAAIDISGVVDVGCETETAKNRRGGDCSVWLDFEVGADLLDYIMTRENGKQLFLFENKVFV